MTSCVRNMDSSLETHWSADMKFLMVRVRIRRERFLRPAFLTTGSSQLAKFRKNFQQVQSSLQLCCDPRFGHWTRCRSCVIETTNSLISHLQIHTNPLYLSNQAGCIIMRRSALSSTRENADDIHRIKVLIKRKGCRVYPPKCDFCIYESTKYMGSQ